MSICIKCIKCTTHVLFWSSALLRCNVSDEDIRFVNLWAITGCTACIKADYFSESACWLTLESSGLLSSNRLQDHAFFPAASFRFCRVVLDWIASGLCPDWLSMSDAFFCSNTTSELSPADLSRVVVYEPRVPFSSIFSSGRLIA